MKGEKKKKLLVVSYVAVIIFAIHYYSLYYILSSFLDNYFAKGTLSILFAVSSFFCLVASNYFGRFLRRYTNKRTLIFSVITQFLVTITLGFSGYLNLYILAGFFIMHYVLYSLISTSINVFIEEFSEDENSGSIRGTVLTITNFGAILSPFVSSQVYHLVGFPGLFAMSALSLLPLIYLVNRFYANIHEPKYKFINLFQSLKIVRKDRNIRGVIASSFVLNSFYAVVNIYLALYLTKVLHIPMLLYLELLVPVTLIPFILVPYQLGKYSDEIFGEKKPILFGISLMSLIMLSIYIFDITSTNILVWIALIFVARTGATITETGNYAYFYKGVDSRNAGLIAFFQNIVNVGSLFITILGALLIDLFNVDLKILFLIVGLMGFFSLFLIVKIKDGEIKRRRMEKKIDDTELKLTLEAGPENENLESGQQIKEELEKKIKIWA